MFKSDIKFLNEIQEMVAKQQYNEDAINKLINLIVVSQMLAEKEKNNEVVKLLNYISIVGEALAEKLYALRNK